ncbi:MAG: hypothetical protein ACXAE3_09900 [Candidatus Kariarchaeaceae archaeon]|jgi:hypothetical protein
MEGKTTHASGNEAETQLLSDKIKKRLYTVVLLPLYAVFTSYWFTTGSILNVFAGIILVIFSPLVYKITSELDRRFAGYTEEPEYVDTNQEMGEAKPSQRSTGSKILYVISATLGGAVGIVAIGFAIFTIAVIAVIINFFTCMTCF